MGIRSDGRKLRLQIANRVYEENHRSNHRPFRITCEGNIRKEGDEKGIDLPTEYEFDKHGRLIRYSHADGMSPVVEEYTYDGREKHPATMTYTSRYEEGKDIVKCRYTYLETDKQGNWTKRKVVRTVKARCTMP